MEAACSRLHAVENPGLHTSKGRPFLGGACFAHAPNMLDVFIDSMLTNTVDIHCHRKSGIPPYLVSAVLGCWVNDTVLQRLDDGRHHVCREAELSRKQAKETASFLEHGGLT